MPECYDIARKKEVCSVSTAGIKKFLDRTGLGKKYQDDPDLFIKGAYCYADRVYVDCRLLLGDEESEEESKQGDGEKTLVLSEDEMTQRLISFPVSDPSKLRYEKEIMDCWYDHVMKLQGDDGKNKIYSDGIFAAFENELYFSCKGQKKGRAHIVAYDLESEKMRELGVGELAYQVLSLLSGFAWMDMNNTQGGFE